MKQLMLPEQRCSVLCSVSLCIAAPFGPCTYHTLQEFERIQRGFAPTLGDGSGRGALTGSGTDGGATAAAAAAASGGGGAEAAAAAAYVDAIRSTIDGFGLDALGGDRRTRLSGACVFAPRSRMACCQLGGGL
jgi:hypothetical protein